MSSFDDRQKGFEAKFKHDEETRFKIVNRRNKLLGLWAAELLGLSGGEAEAYAKTVVTVDFERPGPDDVIEKLMADFSAKGVKMTDHRIRAEMDRLEAVAVEQIVKV